MKHIFDKRISLDGKWDLFFAPNSTLKKDGFLDKFDASLSTPVLSTYQALSNTGYNHIPATVPGNFELDLLSAGLIADPFFGTNALQLQKFECMHQYYVRKFTFDGTWDAPLLEFEGIDTAAEIFLNGKLIYICENMFISHTVDVRKDVIHGENELVVHIKPATIFARQFSSDAITNHLWYNYGSLSLRKAAGTYGWDILPRAMAGGIWRSVSLLQKPENRIIDLYAFTTNVNLEKNTARVVFRFETNLTEDFSRDYSLEIQGKCGDSEFSFRGELWSAHDRLVKNLKDVKFWMPKNYGEPNLYDMTAKLWYKDTLCDEITWRMGVRTVDLKRTSVIEPDGTKMGKGDFRFFVNGQPIFCMGTNWIPADAFHSRDKERLAMLLPHLSELNCNMVRLWGGNVYEHTDFFDYCDENGILIWQDFGMACGVYPQDAQFVAKLREEIIHVVKKYRNYASLILWSGDNECDLPAAYWNRTYNHDPNTNILTRKLMPEILTMLDATRPFLPSSPYVDDVAYKTGLPTSEEHLWGARDYFKCDYYKNSVCRFASEIGYQGCPEPDSVKKFISPEKMWPWNAEGENYANDEWMVHASNPDTSPESVYAYLIPLFEKHIINFFGKKAEDFETFAMESQISQAEAFKFFIEHFRIQNKYRSGLLWWNMADSWPQFSNAVVDYYGKTKLGYYYIQRAQSSVAIMCDEPENGEIAVYCSAETTENIKISWKITNLCNDKEILSGTSEVKAHESAKIGALPYSDDEQNFYFIEWTYMQNGKEICGKNHFLSGIEKTVSLEKYLEMMKKAGYSSDAYFLR